LVSKVSGSDRLSKIKNYSRGPNGEKVVHKRKFSKRRVKLITAIKAHKLLGRGCKGFLYNVVETKATKPSLQDIPVV